MRLKIKDVISIGLLFLTTLNTKGQTKPVPDSVLQLVKEAYIYGFPAEQVYRMYVTLPDQTNQTHRVYNHFSYADKLASASGNNTQKMAAYRKTRNRGGAGPNNDTPYFGSLLDLTGGPLVLTVPDFGNRYYSFHFIDFANRNAFYIGSSFGDTVAGRYLIAGPGWKGKLPKGLKLIQLKVNRLNLFGRTLVEDDSTDLKNVLAIQHKASLTALSKWPAEEGKDAGLETAQLPEFYNSIDSFFTNLNNSLRLSPAPDEEKAELRRLSALGIGTKKGFQWSDYDENTRKQIHDVLISTDSMLDADGASGDEAFGNGWQRTNRLIGHWGGNYLARSQYMKHGFYAGHTETECFYIVPVSREGHGYFKGDRKYQIHFAKGDLPPVKAKGFWSVTANEIPGYFLIPNPVNRYAIRDRTKGLKYNDDGSLDIFLQSEEPEAGKKSNWLPIAKGESTVTVRVYLPEESLLNGKYKLPRIETTD